MVKKQCISSQYLRVLLNSKACLPLGKSMFAAAIALFLAACEAPPPEMRNVNTAFYDGSVLKVISFNMLHPGPFGRWSEYDGDADRTMNARFELLIRTLVAEHPDIVILQEGSYTGENRYGNSIWNLVEAVNARLAEEGVNYNAAFAVSNGDPFGLIDFYDGNGILSRYQILDIERTVFTDQARSFIRQSRSALRATLLGNSTDIDVIGLHLEGSMAARNVKELLEVVIPERLSPNPVIIAGDLNQTPETEAVTQMTDVGYVDVWSLLHPAEGGLTSGRRSLRDPAPKQTKRIDFMFASPDFEVVSSELFLDEPIRMNVDGENSWIYGSDHTGLKASLRLKGN